MRLTKKQLRQMILNEVTERKGIERYMQDINAILRDFYSWMSMSERFNDAEYFGDDDNWSMDDIQRAENERGKQTADIISYTVNKFLIEIDPERSHMYRQNMPSSPFTGMTEYDKWQGYQPRQPQFDPSTMKFNIKKIKRNN